jgi:hypothetical protein
VVLTDCRPARQDRQVSILGTRVIRTEDPRFLTTGGVYTADVQDEQLAGACSGAVPGRGTQRVRPAARA